MEILYNARIYTLHPGRPTASALAVDGDRILAVGSEVEILSLFHDAPPAFDLQGRTVIPGLTDAHIHLEHYAVGLRKIDCETPTRAGCLERVAERARKTSPGSWVLGHGWNQNLWPEGFGRGAELGEVAPHHPVYLTAKSLHAAWANSAALRLAGITADTPDPKGGRLERDESGNPTGFLFETAMDLVYQAIPELSLEELQHAIREAQPVLWRLGLTGVHDFDRRRCFMALQELRAAGELRLRVLKSIPLEDLPHAAALGLRTGFGDEFLRIGPVKVFADGALGPQTAAMLQPYEGSPDNRGMLMMDAEEIYEHGRMAVESGLSMTVHAIGDRANHEVLDAYSHLRDYERSLGRGKLRHRIEHVQLLHPDDVGRLAELNVIASMQPIHATSDMRMADRYWGERAIFSYAWRSQLERGAVLAFGSDAPVESPNPFWGIHAAVTRRAADGSPGQQGWIPAQRLMIHEALQAYTRGAAFAAGLEDRLGMLAPGFYADLIVLDANPFLCDEERLRSIRSLGTMIGGEWVWREI